MTSYGARKERTSSCRMTSIPAPAWAECASAKRWQTQEITFHAEDWSPRRKNTKHMTKLTVKPEGRKDIYLPDKESLKAFIKARKLKNIHNYIPTSMMMIGADHDVKGVLEDIDRADRLAVFTDPHANMGHSLALIEKEKLACYDIGKITVEDLEISLQ